MKPESLSVVIPAFNEEHRLLATLRKVSTYLKKNFARFEIIVVDDGSTDRTIEIASSVSGVKVLSNSVNKGKGYSVKQGMLMAQHEWVLFSDADCSTPIAELDKFYKYCSVYDVIIGSRNLDHSDVQIKQPKLRSTLGNLFPFFVNVLTVKGIKDTQCGFKLFSRHAAQELFSCQTVDGFAFDVEILYLAQKMDYTIKEIPVVWRNDRASKVNILIDPLKMLVSLGKIRFRHR